MMWLLGALGLTGGGLGIAALLGGGPAMLLAAKWLWSWLSHATFLQVVCGALAAAWGDDHLALLASHRHAHKVETLLSKEVAGRQADRAAYAKAQADATVANLAHNAADKAERERITNDISQSYEAQLASLRADLAKRLRVQPAAKGAPGQSGLPGVSPAPSGPDETGTVCIPSQDYVSGAETELQLDYLERWVKGQSKLDPNKP